MLIVDTTSTRIRTTDHRWYSGHKKRHVAKVQVLCDERGIIQSVSKTYPGSIHDEAIWDREFDYQSVCSKVPADKAYAGGKGENEVLFRPIRRNEAKWKNDQESAKQNNRDLSKRRIKIEHVFARMKSWRILHHFYPMRPENFALTFKAVAYLNNLGLAENEL